MNLPKMFLLLAILIYVSFMGFVSYQFILSEMSLDSNAGRSMAIFVIGSGCLLAIAIKETVIEIFRNSDQD